MITSKEINLLLYVMDKIIDKKHLNFDNWHPTSVSKKIYKEWNEEEIKEFNQKIINTMCYKGFNCSNEYNLKKLYLRDFIVLKYFKYLIISDIIDQENNIYNNNVLNNKEIELFAYLLVEGNKFKDVSLYDYKPFIKIDFDCELFNNWSLEKKRKLIFNINLFNNKPYQFQKWSDEEIINFNHLLNICVNPNIKEDDNKYNYSLYNCNYIIAKYFSDLMLNEINIGR